MTMNIRLTSGSVSGAIALLAGSAAVVLAGCATPTIVEPKPVAPAEAQVVRPLRPSPPPAQKSAPEEVTTRSIPAATGEAVKLKVEFSEPDDPCSVALSKPTGLRAVVRKQSRMTQSSCVREKRVTALVHVTNLTDERVAYLVDDVGGVTLETKPGNRIAATGLLLRGVLSPELDMVSSIEGGGLALVLPAGGQLDMAFLFPPGTPREGTLHLSHDPHPALDFALDGSQLVAQPAMALQQELPETIGEPLRSAWLRTRGTDKGFSTGRIGPPARERIAGIQELAKIGAPAIPALVEALGDGVDEVERAAAAALKKLAKSANQALPSLAVDPTPRTRGLAMIAVGLLKPPTAQELLRAGLADSDEAVRARAVAALGAFPTSATIETLKVTLSSATDAFAPDKLALLPHGLIWVSERGGIRFDVGATAAATLALLGQPGLKALKDASLSAPTGTRRRIVVGLAFGNSQAAATQLVPLLEDEDAWIRENAVFGLGRQQHRPALARLRLMAEKDASHQVRASAAEASKQLGAP